MKARTLISICLMAGAAAWAQSAPPSQKVAPGAATSAKSAAKAAPAQKTAMPATKAAVKPAAKPTPAQAAPAKPAAHKSVVKPAVKKSPVKAASATGTTEPVQAAAKRDPFVNPVRTEGPTGPTCATGKKCLAIDVIDLKGIVKSHVGMIAVVESSTRKVTYFLRENDPVFNGYVVKITGDSVVFRENVMDRLGHESTRDVVKKVVAPVV